MVSNIYFVIYVTCLYICINDVEPEVKLFDGVMVIEHWNIEYNKPIKNNVKTGFKVSISLQQVRYTLLYVWQISIR